MTLATPVTRAPSRRALDPQQRGSHNRLLLWNVPLTGEQKQLDALIVPTARPHPYLADTIKLANELKVPLLLLCSKWASAGESIEKARASGVRAIAVDVCEPIRGMPSFATSEMLAGLRFERRTDVSLKRNIGLAVARMLGWQRLMFLDDDIDVAEPDHIRQAAALLGRFGAVGLFNNGFPDNSVVCHANRATGHEQGSFIGGGAMAVLATRGNAFFPNIYNEDWFFLLDEQKLCDVVATGHMVQKDFDPFQDPRRARAEEFGDVLAEGIYAILDQDGRVSDADEKFWRDFLGSRRELINRCLATAMLPENSGKEQFVRMAAALKAARGRLEHITPDLCVAYLRAWQRDRRVWRAYLKKLPRFRGPAEALEALGLRPYSTL